jgi:hypothetical protein
MATDLVQTELEEFHAYVGQRLRTAKERLSPEEVLDEWLLLHPDPQVHEENVKAIKAAIRDMEARDRGRPAEEVLQDIHNELGLSGK